MNMTPENFEKFTKEAKNALLAAQEIAGKTGTNYVGTEHLLIGVLSQAESLGCQILNKYGVTLENVNLVLKTVGRTSAPGQGKGPEGLSGFAKKVIEDAIQIAHNYSHPYVGTEHILHALTLQDNTAATVILENMKVSAEELRQNIESTFGKKGVPEKTDNNTTVGTVSPPPGTNPLEFFLNSLQGAIQNDIKNNGTPPAKTNPQTGEKSKTPALDYFTDDLIAEAAAGKLNPVIGREDEIERCISILLRKTKNNPVLIGEPGVGKTAVIEGLAQRIYEEKVPHRLQDMKILSLSMASVVAGTKYRGEFEDRIKQIIEECSNEPNIILFIDELHTVIGAGSAEGSLDAANILKPALSRGKIQVIGATTTTEFRKHIEQDSALERRFQSILVEEPKLEEALEIIRGLRESFEDHHQLLISDEAIDAAVHLSRRYVSDRFLPDKAIDLLDEAASLKSMKLQPENTKFKKLQKKLKEIVQKKEEAVTKQDYEHAATLRQTEIVISEDLEKAKQTKIPKEKREKIDQEDIAKVISRMTGVPAQKLLEEDMLRLRDLEETLKASVIGQEEAVKKVAQAIRRSRTGISSGKRPIASFLFLGPTGVGKTELVRTLAKEVYNDEDALIKMDMSEFMERHNTSRLTGTTAGYVGYEDGGQLTEKIRRKPYSVVLFDEIEKAHPDVFNLLLQVLEDGELSDGKGRKVNFRNTIIILTSNIGARKLTESAAKIGFSVSQTELEAHIASFEHKKDDVLKELKKSFKPELLNRLDSIIVFKPLNHETIKEIVRLQVKDLENRLAVKGLRLELDESAWNFLAKESTDPEYGARPARRKVQEHLEDAVAEKLVHGEIQEGDTIQVSYKDELTFTKKRSKKKVA